jgi:hypothetical protein
MAKRTLKRQQTRAAPQVAESTTADNFVANDVVRLARDLHLLDAANASEAIAPKGTRATVLGASYYNPGMYLIKIEGHCTERVDGSYLERY